MRNHIDKIIHKVAHNEPTHSNNVARIQDDAAPDKYLESVRNEENRTYVVLTVRTPSILLVNLTFRDYVISKLLLDKFHGSLAI